jgi:hypothetical protein
VCNPQSRIY